MNAIVCAFHRWFRFAHALEAEVWKCKKCGTLLERPAASPPPDPAARGKS